MSFLLVLFISVTKFWIGFSMRCSLTCSFWTIEKSPYVKRISKGTLSKKGFTDITAKRAWRRLNGVLDMMWNFSAHLWGVPRNLQRCAEKFGACGDSSDETGRSYFVRNCVPSVLQATHLDPWNANDNGHEQRGSAKAATCRQTWQDKWLVCGRGREAAHTHEALGKCGSNHGLVHDRKHDDHAHTAPVQRALQESRQAGHPDRYLMLSWSLDAAAFVGSIMCILRRFAWSNPVSAANWSQAA